MDSLLSVRRVDPISTFLSSKSHSSRDGLAVGDDRRPTVNNAVRSFSSSFHLLVFNVSLFTRKRIYSVINLVPVSDGEKKIIQPALSDVMLFGCFTIG